MAKIVCPHCKAVNQDVSGDDPCWQCGTLIGAPVSAIETAGGAPSSEANPANATASSNLQVQKEIEKTRPAGGTPPSERPRASSTNVSAIVIGTIILVVLVAVILFYVMKHH